jgi:hypothetical protein
MYLGRPVTDEQSIIDEAGPAALTPTLRLAHHATSTQSRSQFSAQLPAALHIDRLMIVSGRACIGSSSPNSRRGA